MVKKVQKYPVYNPAVDGNPFYWIVQTSAQIRRKNINGQGGQPASMPPIKPL